MGLNAARGESRWAGLRRVVWSVSLGVVFLYPAIQCSGGWFREAFPITTESLPAIVAPYRGGAWRLRSYRWMTHQCAMLERQGSGEDFRLFLLLEATGNELDTRDVQMELGPDEIRLNWARSARKRGVVLDAEDVRAQGASAGVLRDFEKPEVWEVAELSEAARQAIVDSEESGFWRWNQEKRVLFDLVLFGVACLLVVALWRDVVGRRARGGEGAGQDGA